MNIIILMRAFSSITQLVKVKPSIEIVSEKSLFWMQKSSQLNELQSKYGRLDTLAALEEQHQTK
jgi:hypothetical protein